MPKHQRGHSREHGQLICLPLCLVLASSSQLTDQLEDLSPLESVPCAEGSQDAPSC